MQPELNEEKKSTPVLEVHRPTGPKLTLAEKKSLGELVIHKAKELTESGAKLVITTTRQHKVATTIAASTLLGIATHFIVAMLMMSDTKVSVRPYVIGPTSTSFQVPSGGCTAATNFIGRTSGFSAGDITRYTNLICDLVSDGVITGDLSGARGCGTKLDLFYVLAAPTQANSLFNLCGTDYSLVANNSPTFSANNGWTGVDSSAGGGGVHLTTQFTPSTATSPVYVQNSGHISVWAANDFTGTALGGSATGFQRGDNSCLTVILPKYFGDGLLHARIQDLTVPSGVAIANSSGFIVGNRTGASASTMWKNGSLLSSPNNTSCDPISTLQNGPIFILAGDKGGSPDFGYGGQVSAMTLGAQLTAGDISNLCHRLNQFLTSANGYASIC